MIITVREAARMLETDEPTVYRLIGEGTIPVHKVRDQYRFNREELLEWAMAHGTAVSVSDFSAPESSAPAVSLQYALSRGGVHDRVLGGAVDSALEAIVQQLPIREDTKDLTLEVLRARGGAGCTSAGDGIAIPHARSPLLVPLIEPSVTLSYIDPATPLFPQDRRGVGAIFSIVAPTVRIHLLLLSRLVAALRDREFRNAVLARAPQALLLAHAERVEQLFVSPRITPSARP